MTYREEEDIDGDLLPDKRKERIKEELLDETFKKAEISHRHKPSDKKIITKRPFLKSGIILLVIALLCLVIIDNVPWMYIKYNDTEDGTIELLFNKDFQIVKLDNVENVNDSVIEDINGLFESQCTNCSNNSQHFIGLSIDDFSSVPKMAFYAFIILALMGIIFTIFQVINKIKRFSLDTSAIIHTIFAAGVILTSIYILVLIIKFFGAYFMLHYNGSFIAFTDLRLVFMAPLILIIILPLIISGAIAITKMNFNELKKKLKTDIPEDSFSVYRVRGISR